jgi:hypothetical protein
MKGVRDRQRRAMIGSVFNLGAGEITVLGLLVLIFLGPKDLPNSIESLGASISERLRFRISAPTPRRWAWSDWVLVIAACASGAIALALLTGVRP